MKNQLEEKKEDSSYTIALKISYENALRELNEFKEKAQLLASRVDMLDECQDRDIQRIAELEAENKRLTELLGNIIKAYIKFEVAGKNYNKALGILDDLIMNR